MTEIHGTVAPGFERVRDAFSHNFTDHQEVGAGFCVYRDGQPVVDLWGGLADPATGRAWQRDTLANVASVTKTMAATATLMLVDRGRLDLDERVATYWPEFAAEGKGDVTLRMLLSHRAGVPSLAHHPLTYEDLLAGTPVFDAIAAARPEWEPGTKHGYHGLTIGHALSAIIQRVTGETVGPFFAKEIAAPLGMDCFIGLPDADVPRLATMVVPDDPEMVALGMNVPELRSLYMALADPSTLTYRALYGSMAFGWETANDPRYVQVEAPSTDGIASAAGLAKLYAALVGEVDGILLVGPDVLAQASRLHSSGTDEILHIHTDIGLGFMRRGGPLFPSTAGPAAFGHGGATGSFALADPDHTLALGYVPNRGSELLEGNDLRIVALVEAAYASL